MVPSLVVPQNSSCLKQVDNSAIYLACSLISFHVPSLHATRAPWGSSMFRYHSFLCLALCCLCLATQ